MRLHRPCTVPHQAPHGHSTNPGNVSLSVPFTTPCGDLVGVRGAHIDPVRAMVLGLIGDCDPEAVRSVGNAAGTGAVRALLSGSQRAEMESVIGEIRKIETATEPRFQKLFVAAMALPHATAPSPLLGAVVDLPERGVPHGTDARTPAATGARRRPRNRRRR